MTVSMLIAGLPVSMKWAIVIFCGFISCFIIVSVFVVIMKRGIKLETPIGGIEVEDEYEKKDETPLVQ